MNRPELAFEYVFGSLLPAERADARLRRTYDRALDAEIECIETRMGPLALAPVAVDVPATLWDRVAADIAADAFEHPETATEYFKDGGWWPLQSDIAVKRLWDDHSFLVRCAPGAVIRAHHHKLSERMLVLVGEIKVCGRVLRVGDSQFSPAGSDHREIFAANGCTLLIQRVREAA